MTPLNPPIPPLRKGGGGDCPPRLVAILCLAATMCSPLLATTSHAQGPPINTESAIITGFQSAARSFVQVTRKSGPLPKGGTGDLTVIAVPLMIPYQLVMNRVVLIAAIPYIYMELDAHDTTTKTFSNSGFGDLRLLGEFNLFQRDAPRSTVRATVISGLELPTGEDTPPLRLGSRSVDIVLGSAFTYGVGRFSINTDVIYTRMNEARSFEFGDILKYDVAVGFRLFPAVYEEYPARPVNVYLEFNGLHSRHDTTGGLQVPDSGGNTIFLSPGIQFIAGRTFLVEGSVQIPLVEDLNGRQLETDYSFLIGFRWLLF